MSRGRTTEYVRLDGRLPLRKGDELTVRGIGRCRFAFATLGQDGDVLWLDVFEQRCGNQRCVAPSAVTKVHRTTKLRASS